MENAIGIIGGYSLIGRHCAAAIAAATPHPLCIAGRDQEKANRIAQALPNAQGAALDIYNQQQLAAFCSRCSIVINCAGPSTVILDRVALAALEYSCHYIDVGGYDILYDLLKDKHAAIQAKGLYFLLSAGWIPGVSGVFPVYLAQLAEKQQERIDSLEVFISGKEKWSYGSCRDMVWAMFEDFSGVYQYGQWVKKSIVKDTKKVRLPQPSGKQLVYPMFNNQLKDFSIRSRYPLVAEYMGSEEFSWRTTLLIMYIKMFLKKNKEKAARLFQKAINRDMEHAMPAGLVHVVIKNAMGKVLEGSLLTGDNNRLTGTAPALAARMLLEGQLQGPGLHYLCNAVNPDRFMQLLAMEGFEYNVNQFKN